MDKLTPLEGMRAMELEACDPRLAQVVHVALVRAREQELPPRRFARLLVILGECVELSDDNWALALYESALEMDPSIRILGRLKRVRRRL